MQWKEAQTKQARQFTYITEQIDVVVVTVSRTRTPKLNMSIFGDTLLRITFDPKAPHPHYDANQPSKKQDHDTLIVSMADESL
nr:unnamed protein product [Digitaria exilis]